MAIWTSLRSKLIFYILSITFLVLISLAGISYLTLGGFLRANLMETTRYKLRIAMDNIDRDFDRLVQLVNYFTLAPDIAAFVSSSEKYPDDRKFKALSAHRTVKDAVYGNGLDGYIDKLVIGGFQGHSIQFGLLQGHRGDFDVARAEYAALGGAAPGSRAWGGLIQERFAFSSDRMAIPVGKGVYRDDDSNKPIGFAFMAVNQEVIARFLSGYDLEEGSRLFIAIGGETYEIIERRDLKAAGEGEGTAGLRLDIVEGQDYIEAELEGRPAALIVSRGLATGWALAQTLPAVRTAQARGLTPSLLVVAGFIVLLVILVLITVNRTVNQPIALINKRVALVSKGDFSHDPDIEWPNELGDIGRAVNRMSRDIEELIERRVEDEKAKKSLEFRALQNQINPHFLYNALGAIKWMAEIQKAPGIAEMVNSLSALLRHAAKGAETLVALELELELVGEYCTIQRYRSANLFELEISLSDESLKRCEIVKFTLQPIVENAIMHGIEPKMVPGHIRIEVDRPRPDLVRIDVVDDGVGIEEERLAVFPPKGALDDTAFNHIGLGNVDERLKLAFGEEYGLSIESVAGDYTKVSVLIPYRTDRVGREGVGEACIPC